MDGKMTDNNPIIEAIKTRRSVRKYTEEPVSRELISIIVDCGRMAPSSKNIQPWEFVVVTDRDTLAQIAELTDNGKFIADASACIVVCGDPKSRSVYLDGAAATENMLLAMHALGLAGCWVQAYEKPYEKTIQNLLGIPEGLVLVSLFSVAYAAKQTPAPKKRSLDEVLHWERF